MEEKSSLFGTFARSDFFLLIETPRNMDPWGRLHKDKIAYLHDAILFPLGSSAILKEL